ncbi:VWA domain-containing protein [Bacillus sonorensis]|nr:hypothetical protein [Bacillus sonorensis]MCY8034529.1 VWA domain-containing protein [Bacillus sonorensis]MCY8563200.1 VWA domain-containing protein [Bacillus sonorensis]
MATINLQKKSLDYGPGRPDVHYPGSGSLYKNGTVQQTVERVLPVAGRLPMTGY